MATRDEMIQALTDAVKATADKAAESASRDSLPSAGGWASTSKALAEALSAVRSS